MPEEYEEQEITETEPTEEVPKVEAEEEPRVPVSVVKELRDELRQAKEDGNITRGQLNKLMSDYQEAIRMQKPLEPQQDLDPEILKLLKPYLKPFEDEIGRTKAELNQIKESRAQTDNERYIERNLPNLDKIRGELLKEIQSYPADEQTEILANPREIVRMGKLIERSLANGSPLRAENRSRARTETGSTSTRLESDGNVDAKVAKWLKDNNL